MLSQSAVSVPMLGLALPEASVLSGPATLDWRLLEVNVTQSKEHQQNDNRDDRNRNL